MDALSGEHRALVAHRRRIAVVFPREHGAWAMMSVPYIAGLLAGWGADDGRERVAAGVAGLIAVVLLHLGRPSLVRLLKRRVLDGDAAAELLPLAAGAAAFLLPGIAVFLYLGFAAGYPDLVWLAGGAAILGAWHTIHSVRRRERTEVAELIGVALLTMTAPLGYYLGRGSLGMEAFTLWALSALYFGASIFVVRARLRGFPQGEAGRRFAGNKAAAYLLFMAAAVAVIVIAGGAPALVAFAFLPAFIWSIISLARTGSRLKVKREGIVQSVLSVWFLVILAAAFY